MARGSRAGKLSGMQCEVYRAPLPPTLPRTKQGKWAAKSVDAKRTANSTLPAVTNTLPRLTVPKKKAMTIWEAGKR